jgi:hypothetical protein
MRVRPILALISAVAVGLAAHGVAQAGKGSGGASKGSKADYRSAKSGKYVKKDYADKNKDTTVREERKKK